MLGYLRDTAENLVRRFVANPPVVAGVVVAALNTAEDQSWEGYAVAVGVALLRYVVQPVWDFRNNLKR